MNGKKDFLSEENCVKDTLQLLKKNDGYEFSNMFYINRGRYCIVQGSPMIAILLKSEPFFNFGKMFKKYGEKGMGDTINCEALKIFVRYGVELIYMRFKDGRLYAIRLEDFLKDSYKWQQKEGTWVRSVSIHKYKRVIENDI